VLVFLARLIVNQKNKGQVMSNEQDQRPGEEQVSTGGDAVEDEKSASAGSIDFEAIPRFAVQVITNPVGFYQNMKKGGGYAEPLVFVIALSVAAGVLSAVLSVFGFGMATAMTAGLIAVILIPIFVVIFSFIGAGIAYVIWKMMGSQEDFETAFRCVAYTAAIAPINAVLGVIPYLGTIVSALWPLALLAIASIHVHRRSTQVSWGVFGALGILLVLMGLGSERASRQMADGMQDWQQMMEEARRQAD
jgi:hypothetical protein